MSKPELFNTVSNPSLSQIEKFKSIFEAFVTSAARDYTVNVVDKGESMSIYMGKSEGDKDDPTALTLSSIQLGPRFDREEKESDDEFSINLIEHAPDYEVEAYVVLSRNASLHEEYETRDAQQIDLALGRVARMLTEAQ